MTVLWPIFGTKSVIAWTPEVNSETFFRNGGIRTTNLHCVIFLFGLYILLSSKSRFSVLFQCFYGKNDRFLAHFWNKKSYCTDPRCQFRNVFSQWWHNHNRFAFCDFTVWSVHFVVFKKSLFCPIQGWYNTVRVMYCIVSIQHCNLMYCIANFSDKVMFIEVMFL